MRKVISDKGQERLEGCKFDSPFSAEIFHNVPMPYADEGDTQYALHTDIGSLTVLNRMTGFGWHDIETGYRDMDGKFWLASGGYDVRNSECETLGDAITWVKQRANTCNPDE